MATLIVSYPAAEGMDLDREYYLATHISLVRAAWGECGLQSVEVLFPAPAHSLLPASRCCVSAIRLESMPRSLRPEQRRWSAM